jgi:adenosylcobinamide kinase/adenosylcobinamide-phosphate guanylyltransferase
VPARVVYERVSEAPSSGVSWCVTQNSSSAYESGSGPVRSIDGRGLELELRVEIIEWADSIVLRFTYTARAAHLHGRTVAKNVLRLSGMGKVIFVTGGTRSGKSVVSERLVEPFGDKLTYIATANLIGPEAIARSAKHRARRPPSWQFMRETHDLVAAFANVEAGRACVMLECLYGWTTNRLVELGDERTPEWVDKIAALEVGLLSELDQLVELCRKAPFHTIMVSSEVGSGTAPDRPRPRRFRDLVGLVNERAATRADAAYLVVAGAVLDLKKLSVDVNTLASSLFA